MLILSDNERWIPGYEGRYTAAESGSIYSYYRDIRREKVTCFDKNGYRVVSLYHPQKRPKLAKVHRLVATVFLGENNPLQVNHMNGLKRDNRVENLEWVTNSQNKQHAFDTGLTKMGKGEENPSVKLDSESVLEIRIRWSNGESQRSLERFYNLARGSVWPIVHGLSWRHI